MEAIEKNFRPGLLIFVGVVGKAVYDYFFEEPDPVTPALIEYMKRIKDVKKPLTSHIQFVRPDANGTTYQYQMASSLEAISGQNLKNAIESMCDRFIYEVAGDEPSKQETDAPLLYVIGHISDTQMREAVHVAREKGPSWSIQCLCSCYPLEQSVDELGRGDELAGRNRLLDELVEWGQKMRLDFCYLFGNAKSDIANTEVDRARSYYDLAQALFALLNMGALSQQYCKESESFRLGTLSTCLITVPQKAIVHAYRAQVAALLIKDWLTKNDDLCKDSNNDKQVRELADRDIAFFKQQIGEQGQDSSVYMQEKYMLWPSKVPQLRGLNKVFDKPLFKDKKSAHSLLQRTPAQSIQSIEKSLKHWPAPIWPPSQKWLKRVEEYYKTMYNNILPAQKHSIEDAWAEVYRESMRRLNETIHSLKDDTQKGVAWIIAYADILDKELEKLQQSTDVQEKDESIHTRDWNDKVHLSLQKRLLGAIGQQLEGSTLLVLIGLAGISIAVFSLLLLSIFTSILEVSGWLQWSIAVFLPIIGVLTLNWFSLKRYYLPSIEVARTLLNDYRSIVASYYRNEEQRQYGSLLQALRSHIQSMRSSDLEGISKRLEEDARGALAMLFTSATAHRHIFISKNGYFPQKEDFAIEDFLAPKTERRGEQKPTPKEVFDQLANQPSFSNKISALYLLGETGDSNDNAQKSIDGTSNQMAGLYTRINTSMKSQVSNETLQDLFRIPDSKLTYRHMWDELNTRLYSNLGIPGEDASEVPYLYIYGSNATLNVTHLQSGTYLQRANTPKGEIVEISTSPIQPYKAPTEAPVFDWLLVAVLHITKHVADR